MLKSGLARLLPCFLGLNNFESKKVVFFCPMRGQFVLRPKINPFLCPLWGQFVLRPKINLFYAHCGVNLY
jgi:hypothetical protein